MESKGLKEVIKENIDKIFAMTLTFLFIETIFISGANINAEKVTEYEKILNHEYGRLFESYNEYLVYKIERGY